MRKIFQVLTIGILILFACNASLKSNEIEIQHAVKVAINVAKANFNIPVDDYQVRKVHFYPDLSLPTIFIIELRPSGFVMVANEINSYPVLGYSDKGQFSWDDLPPALEQMIQDYNLQILQIRENGFLANDEILSRWNYYTAEDIQVSREVQEVSPLLTTEWNQNRYYNTMCPVDSSVFPNMNYHVPAGCFPVAMAQILKFHNHPAWGEGQNSYNLPEYGELSADFETPGYDYEQMPNMLEATNEEVARLIYHCGIALNTAYAPLGSLAFIDDIKSALVNHFFFQDEIQKIYRASYSDEEWMLELKTELDMGRPIIYRGTGNNGGHGWVCDGYDAEDLFHMNWGWGGSFDGYFMMSDLHPAGYSFNEGQMALINMIPLVTSVSEIEDEAFIVYPNPATDMIKIRYQMPDTRYQMPDARCQMIGLFTIDGRKIWEKELNETVIDISELPAGLYMIRIQNEHDILTRKLIKQ